MLLDLYQALAWGTQPATGPHMPVASGSSGWDAGSGEVWRAGKKIKATKAARVGISAQYLSRPSAVVRVRAISSTFRAQVGLGHAAANAAVALKTESVTLALHDGCAAAHSCNKSNATSMIVSSYNGACATLGMDEILALLHTR